MANLDNDIKYVMDLLEGKISNTFDFIYSRSNENLIELFNRINLEGKDVYTVLSSSDFLLSAVYQGAKKVDCFDIMPITYRYFHLRRWLAQYGLEDANGLSKTTLLQIVNSTELNIKSENEKDSIIFWQYLLNKIYNMHFYSSDLFEYIENVLCPFSDMREINKKLNIIDEPVFDNIDICEEIKYDDKRKYDVVYLSNIIDYNREKLKIEKLILNVLKLLKDKGSIICAHMSQFENFEIEQEMFSKYFNYDEIYFEDNLVQEITYYRYKKK